MVKPAGGIPCAFGSIGEMVVVPAAETPARVIVVVPNAIAMLAPADVTVDNEASLKKPPTKVSKPPLLKAASERIEQNF